MSQSRNLAKPHADADQEESNRDLSDGGNQSSDGNQFESFLSIKTVREETGLSTTTIRQLMREGKFPLPYQLSPQRVGWKRSEIERWKQALQAGPLPAPKFGAHRGRKVSRRPARQSSGLVTQSPGKVTQSSGKGQ